MISTLIAASVPIVSQRGIDPIKTAISLLLALVTTMALTEPPPVPKPPGQACDHAIAERMGALRRAAHARD
jgi:hypothetical protein